MGGKKPAVLKKVPGMVGGKIVDVYVPVKKRSRFGKAARAAGILTLAAGIGTGIVISSKKAGRKTVEQRKAFETLKQNVRSFGLVRDAPVWAEICRVLPWKPGSPRGERMISFVERISGRNAVQPVEVLLIARKVFPMDGRSLETMKNSITKMEHEAGGWRQRALNARGRDKRHAISMMEKSEKRVADKKALIRLLDSFQVEFRRNPDLHHQLVRDLNARGVRQGLESLAWKIRKGKPL